MPFEFPAAQNIAIIGAGVSGLSAAYELSAYNQVTLFEAESRLGGHARTVMAGRNGDVPVDTGFIVFNHHNYPNLTRMFDELDVPTKKSIMGFAASIGGGEIEYGLNNLSALTAQRRNLLRPQYMRMISDILRFQKLALRTARDPDMTLGAFLDELRLGEWFRRYYLLPMAGAIWSSTPEQMEDFPARSLVQFFHNHALLTTKQHQWHTVDGGSIQYVSRIARAIEGNGGIIRAGSAVQGVRRRGGGAEIRVTGGEWQRFDKVIFACHSDQAIRMLEDPTAAERKIVGAIRYQPNTAVLHRDESQMPRRRKCWTSWVFVSPDRQPRPQIGLTYWMNSLQGIPESEPLFVSLNPAEPIRDELVYDQAEFSHPVFDRAAMRAQQALPSIQGLNGTYFCGAWTRWGFHEDGYHSAMQVVESIRSEERFAAA